MKYTEKTAEYQKLHRQRNRAKWLDYLKSHPCIDCGESDPIVLDFDHIDPHCKSTNISRLVGGSHCSWDRILIEIQKCEVRCSNCHRRRTHKQFDYYDIEKYKNLKDLPQPQKEQPHGTNNGYNYYKCRCERCTEAHRIYLVAYRKTQGGVSPLASNEKKG